jgi:hypothetical protein
MEWFLPKMTRFKLPTIGEPPLPLITVILACSVLRSFLLIIRHATQYLIQTSQLYYKHTLNFRKIGGKQMNLCIKAKLYNHKFDCRDDGACRYRWEEEILKYFGAGVTETGASADFHKFEFEAADAAKPDYEYYNQSWFQMCFFLEQNFRKRHRGLTLQVVRSWRSSCWVFSRASGSNRPPSSSSESV